MEGHCHKVWKEGILIFSDCAHRLYDAMAKNFLTTLSRSKFYLSLGVSYPNIEDANRGLEVELITAKEHAEIVKAITQKQILPQSTKLGGEMYIHGHGDLTDWIAGCIALANKDIKEIYEAIQVKVKVRIEP